MTLSLSPVPEARGETLRRPGSAGASPLECSRGLCRGLLACTLPLRASLPSRGSLPWRGSLFRGLALFAWVCALLAWANPARAGSTAQDTLAGVGVTQEQPRDTLALAPLVVSVLRSPARLDRLPFSAAVLTGQELVQGNTGLFIKEALHGLPGVRVQNRYNASVGERISIRGFGTRSQFGVRGIKILVDGVPATLPDGQTTLDHLDIGSLGRVEALRGPAASIYGNGAGGVILFTSAAPYTGSYQQDVTFVSGSDGLLRLQATGSGTAGTLGFRASVTRSRYEGFRNNAREPGSAEDPYSQAERTTVNAGFTNPLAGGNLAVRLIGFDLDAMNPGSLPSELFLDGSSQAWNFNVIRQTRKLVRQGQAGVSWRGPVGGLEGTLSAYGVSRKLDNPIPTSVIDLDRRGGGLRLAMAKAWGTGTRTARAELGIEGDIQDDDRKNYTNQGGRAADLTLDQQERVRAAAFFAQLRLPLGSRLDFAGALRYDHFSFRADDRLITADNPDDSGSRAMSALNPSLGLHLDLGQHGLFASVARSLETPTTTELANQPDREGGLNPELDPQRGWTFEGGLRGAFGSRVSYDLALFSSSLTGQLIPFEVPSAPGRRFFRNAGLSSVRGFEASARSALSNWLAGRVGYSYIDARFTEFALGQERFDQNQIPGIAPHRLEAGIRAVYGSWFGELRWETRGEVQVNDANDDSAEGYTLLDLRVGSSGVGLGKLRLSPFVGVTNLNNTRYASSVVVNAFGRRYFEPGPDRGGYAGLSVRWDN